MKHCVKELKEIFMYSKKGLKRRACNSITAIYKIAVVFVNMYVRSNSLLKEGNIRST